MPWDATLGRLPEIMPWDAGFGILLLIVFQKEWVYGERNPEAVSFSFTGKQSQQLFSNLMHCGNNSKINNKPEKLFLFKQKARFFALTFLNIFFQSMEKEKQTATRGRKKRDGQKAIYI